MGSKSSSAGRARVAAALAAAWPSVLSPVCEVAVASLRLWPENPRTISRERLNDLKQSLLNDPAMLWARTIIALRDGTVIMGNQRLLALIELGWETVPVIYADLTWEQARLWALRDNSSYGEFDLPKLETILTELAAEGVDLALTGFASADLDRLLAGIEPPADPDDAPPLPEGPPDSHPGTVYELGEHRLLCEDSTDPDSYAKLFANYLDEVKAEVVWTDPPYGVEYVGKTRRALTIANDGAEAASVFAAAIAAADPYVAESARFYACVPSGPLGTDFRIAIDQAGWQHHQSLAWVKDRFVLGHSDHQIQHEEILYGWKPGPGRPGRGRHQGSRWHGGNNQSSVFFVDRPARSESHPTMKPVALIAAQLTNSSVRGDIVLDSFAGSGSTLIACEQLGRRCLAIEIDPRYCDVIRRRYEDYTNGN